MGKGYTEELAAWVEKRAIKKRRQDAAVVAFMAVKSDVIEARNAGYALTTIWDHMHETGKVKCSYETFRKHYHRFVKATTESSVKATTESSQKISAAKIEPVSNGMPDETKIRPAIISETPAVTGFTFHPNPNKEELL